MEPVATRSSVMEQLRGATGVPELRLVAPAGAQEKLDAAIERANAVLPGTAAEWLDALTHDQGWTWLVRGDDVVVLERRAQVQRQLEKRVSLKYENTELSEVLLDLARMARVTLAMEPGVLNQVPAATRHNFNLTMSDASIAQALEVVSGATGLVFVRTGEGLRVEAGHGAQTTTAPTEQRQRAPYFVRMSFPGPDGASIEVFLRPEELPPDIQARIEQEKDRKSVV